MHPISAGELLDLVPFRVDVQCYDVSNGARDEAATDQDLEPTSVPFSLIETPMK